MSSNHGKVILFLGPMYSGKSTSLISLLQRYNIANRKTVLFKPRIDTRYSIDKVVSHDGASLPAIVVDSHKDIPDLVEDAEAVGIEEVQFFDSDIWRVINNLATLGKDVIVAGLSTDFMGQPFETSARVAMIADKVKKLDAVCVQCGKDAVWTQMVVDGVEVTDGDRVQVGGSELYSPKCRGCFKR
jgi:thymidine kinase